MKNRKTNIRFGPFHPARTIFDSRHLARHMVYILTADKSIPIKKVAPESFTSARLGVG